MVRKPHPFFGLQDEDVVDQREAHAYLATKLSWPKVPRMVFASPYKGVVLRKAEAWLRFCHFQKDLQNLPNTWAEQPTAFRVHEIPGTYWTQPRVVCHIRLEHKSWHTAGAWVATICVGLHPEDHRPHRQNIFTLGKAMGDVVASAANQAAAVQTWAACPHFERTEK